MSDKKLRIAPHGNGGPNDDVLGQTIVGIVADVSGEIRIHLSNGMEIHHTGGGHFNVRDAGATYPLSRWISHHE